MKYPCIESTLDVAAGRYIVRIWRSETELSETYDNSDLKQAIQASAHLLAHELAAAVADQPRVAAVQVIRIEDDNEGVVVYVEWP